MKCARQRLLVCSADPKRRDAPSIVLPHQNAEFISHIAIDIGGSLIKLVYFSPEETQAESWENGKIRNHAGGGIAPEQLIKSHFDEICVIVPVMILFKPVALEVGLPGCHPSCATSVCCLHHRCVVWCRQDSFC